MSAALASLRAVSARLGRDPLQVQGPGGNTSVKTGATMWVKASGTWLAEAETREIMVPVDAAGLKAALVAGGPADAAAFASGDGGLRPSIETAFHAALDWPVVLHTHCVASIAVAVRVDAAAVVADRLGDLGAVFVPYVRPGVELAQAILAAVTPGTRVILLGNHGLIVAEETPEAAEALLRAVSARLDPDGTEPPAPDPDFAAGLDGSGFVAVAHGPTRRVALDPALLALAAGPTLYPDHLVFLGPGVAVARPGEGVAEAAARVARDGPPRRLVLVPGRGAAIPADASPSMRALAHAFGDVLVRMDPAAPVVRLSAAEEHGLLNWDAEKHRQALEAARGRG
jgi:rhamnose utilization protein RhaD (predicted bifunctional aldolase and dehydrogenase)